jgi:hypothetical protein
MIVQLIPRASGVNLRGFALSAVSQGSLIQFTLGFSGLSGSRGLIRVIVNS